MRIDASVKRRIIAARQSSRYRTGAVLARENQAEGVSSVFEEWSPRYTNLDKNVRVEFSLSLVLGGEASGMSDCPRAGRGEGPSAEERR
jgi:hypothetical protein